MNRHYAVLSNSFVLLTTSLIGCAQEAPPPSGTPQNHARRDDSLVMMKEYARWATSHPAGGAMQLDLSNDLHFSVVHHRLTASGKTPDNSPELFRRVAAARTAALTRKATRVANADDPPAWCMQAIPFDEVPRSSGHFKAQSMFTCTGGSDYSYVDISTYATDTSHSDLVLLNQSSTEDYAIKEIETDTIPADIQHAANRVVYMDSLTLAYDQVNDFAGYQPMEAAAAVPDRAVSLTITHPHEIQNAPNGTPDDTQNVIRICIFREGLTDGGRDCDYGAVKQEANGMLSPFPPNLTGTGIAAAIPTIPGGHTWQADPNAYFGSVTPLMTQNGSPVWAFMPMEGTYDSGAAYGTECLNQGTIGTVQMFLLESGGGCKGAPVNSPVGSLQQLPWNATNQNDSRWGFHGLVDFGSTCLGYFQDVKLVVTVTNSGVSCRGARNQSTQVQPIDYRNSCLAEGTMVTLASGRSVPVERVSEGDKVVADGEGGALTVKAISHGYEPFPMVSIRDDKGQRVMVTETHPMLMETGAVVAAKKLVVGDRVMTRRGATRLTSVERIKYDGRVFNFVLGTKEELAAVGPDHRTLFANGFMVGDNVMQRQLEERSKPSRAQALAHLPSAWEADYHNSLVRKRVATR